MVCFQTTELEKRGGNKAKNREFVSCHILASTPCITHPRKLLFLLDLPVFQNYLSTVPVAIYKATVPVDFRPHCNHDYDI